MARKDLSGVLGVHALVWVSDTAPKSMDFAIAQTVKAGYGLLELSLHDIENLDVAATKAALKEANLLVACSRGLAIDADVSSEDREVVARGAALLQKSLATTAGIGGFILSGALFSAFRKYSTPLSSKGRANAVSVLKELAQEAAKTSTLLGLEVCNRYETNVVNTARDALRLADDIGEDNVTIHLDSYHMNIEETDFVRPILEVGDRLGYVHVGENNRGYLGSGHIDFASFFQALSAANYRGPITFESFSTTVVAEGLSGELAIWRNLWSNGFELAVHARQFIKGFSEATASAGA
jgi:D-psicose/D-tagatose/L-ribulose 3-epimerase